MFGLDPGLSLLLVLCLAVACAFEFVNGFHDTANAVATVIYTNSLKPIVAVVWSGIWNFIGVLRGGIEVAMGIVVLLPLEALAHQNSYFSIALILALLGSAIIWNLGTWYLGLPCSSSHTLIGSIIGVGLAFSFMPQNTTDAGVNWSKAGDIGLSLMISPFIGFGLTVLLMYLARTLIKNKEIFSDPKPGKTPPFWIRLILILTCTGVSYAHGNNDGQKGVGLIIVILITLVPLKFALNQEYDLSKSSLEFKKIETTLSALDLSNTPIETAEKVNVVKVQASKMADLFTGKQNTNELSARQATEARIAISGMTKALSKLLKDKNLILTKDTRATLKESLKETLPLTDYAPFWVLILISLSLGTGTMIGWKRIVLTIGEKIGKSHLTYAQGASSELVAASTIYAASTFGLPVSTTQVLTSAIAGSMVSRNGVSNLQPSTIRNIFLAWVLTFPVCIILGGGLFYLFSAFA